MADIVVVFTPQYATVRTLTEDEPMCDGCYHHVEYCQCLQMATIQVPQHVQDAVNAGTCTVSTQITYTYKDH